jgi:hypothetical protein
MSGYCSLQASARASWLSARWTWRGGRRRVFVKTRELGFPILTKLGAHAPLHERPAHRRRVRLQLSKFFRVSLRQQIGNSGEQLRHLHQRPLRAPQSLAQSTCERGLICAHHPRAHGAGQVRANLRHTTDARADAIALWIAFVAHKRAGVVNIVFR